MAKFKAGQTIVAHFEDTGWSTLMVNRVFIDEGERSFNRGQEMYSLDDGNGFVDARERAVTIDRDYVLAD